MAGPKSSAFAHFSSVDANFDMGLSLPRLIRRDPFSLTAGASSSPATNLGTRPAAVGRKNGAASGALGGSAGLLRSLMRSRFASGCQCDGGTVERVRSSSDSCSGDLYSPSVSMLSSSVPSVGTTPSSSSYAAAEGIATRPGSISLETGLMVTLEKIVLLAHKQMPTLSICVVAKKSSVGDMVRPVTGMSTLNQSRRRAATRSHTRTVASMLEVMSQRPSPLNVTSVILFVCPLKRRTNRRVSTSYTRITKSSPATAKRLDSLCSSIFATGDSVSTVARRLCWAKSQNLMLPSAPPVTITWLRASVTIPRTAPLCAWGLP
eukprot:comp11739_c0_seq1/m.6327 comp11739_c0_seq1/g.6327  ORF comp11739_c0_seq1/g.6327 comp11739_c0_seq1/m.6327 type:complete len:320 (+) comp11739_c0_seq1:152-1111(+)